MPYNTVNQLPEYIRKYTNVIQRQWMHVFNTVYEKTHSDKRAMMAANSILKKRFKKKESHTDYFNYLTDKFLKNLKG